MAVDSSLVMALSITGLTTQMAFSYRYRTGRYQDYWVAGCLHQCPQSEVLRATDHLKGQTGFFRAESNFCDVGGTAS